MKHKRDALAVELIGEFENYLDWHEAELRRLRTKLEHTKTRILKHKPKI